MRNTYNNPLIDEIAPCIRIYGGQWFEREDFRDWLAGRRSQGDDTPWTWYKEGYAVGDDWDTVTLYDHGEGPDMPYGERLEYGIPADIWNEIGEAVRDAGYEYAMVWILPYDAGG